MQTKSLGELFDNTELKQVKTLLQQGKNEELKRYLNEPKQSQNLERKGVLPDYLYYVLLHNKNQIIRK
jgi:hypothetical protein